MGERHPAAVVASGSRHGAAGANLVRSVMVAHVGIRGSRLTCCVVAVLSSATLSAPAYAFGGFWSSRTAPGKHAAEKIIFVDNPDSTVTAIIQIDYAGPSQKFVWLIPVPGRPTVGVSSTTVFRKLDAATAPEYLVEVRVKGACKDGDAPKPSAAADYGVTAESPASETTGPVKVDQGSVGPYDYVDIRADPTAVDPAKVATDWLTTNGYDLSGFEHEVLSPYARDGFGFLALKLIVGADADAIRPVSLTYESKQPVIPIRPASLTAHDDLGILVWVFGPSQAVPDNYESLVLNEARIDWSTGGTFIAGTLPAGGAGPFGVNIRKPKNYDAVVTSAANEAGGQGFVTELGGPASQYRESVWSMLDEQEFPRLSKRRYADGIDAIYAANRRFGGWDGWKDAIRGATTLPAGVTMDEFVGDPGRYRGKARVDTARFFRLLQSNVIKPVADTAALLYKAPYLTRLYTTMSASEMTVDPVFDYDGDLAQISNTHVAKQLVECSAALNRSDAPWRLALPRGGVVAGTGGRDWPVSEGSMPANLEIVDLSTSGAGSVVKDNSDGIGSKLFEMFGAADTDVEMPHPPRLGATIGGARGLTSRGPSVSPQRGAKAPSGPKCSISRLGPSPSSVFALWLPLAGALLAGRRRALEAFGLRAS
jgi:hypothetical protein